MTGRKITFLAVFALAAAAAPVAADVKTGVDAWSAGDFDRAVNEWQLPAEQGDADALFNLAQAYRLGRGVTADIQRARELYQEAARKGHLKAADNYGLLLFQQGEQEAAMPLIRAASERGDPRAHYILGLAHFNADFAEKDWVRAYALLTLAQGSGLPQAGEALAQMDAYIPMDQRQQAQLLARDIEAEAGKRRAAELAAIELGAPEAQPQRANALSPAQPPATRPARLAAAPASQAPGQPRSTAAQPLRGDWAVQLGAFGVSRNADRLWEKLSRNPVLRGTTKLLVPAGRVTRLQAAGFASRADASRACSQLKQEGQACLVAQPG